MEFLFNIRGQHIANFVNGQLHAPTGENIGHYMANQDIFIDMSGRYLGEIVQQNRLMYNRSSPHRSVNYGSYGNVGNYGNPGNYGNIGVIGGFEDIAAPWLRSVKNHSNCPIIQFGPIASPSGA